MKQRGFNLVKIAICSLIFPLVFSPYALSQDSYMRSELNFNGDCSISLSDAIAGLKSLAETDAGEDEDTMGKIIHILQMMVEAVSYGIYDGYEDDSGFDKARVIAITNEIPQYRNFHDVNDEDWVTFYGLKDKKYEIKAEIDVLESDCDAVIELYNDSNERLDRCNQFPLNGKNETLTWECTEDGVYYVRLTNNPEMPGKDMRYNLTVCYTDAAIRGHIIGNVFDTASAQFTLTQDCLDMLKENGFQQIDRFNALKDMNYVGTDAFESALDDALNEDINILEEWILKEDYTFQSYKALIMECAVDKSVSKVAGAIVKTEWRAAISNYCDCFSYCKRDYCIYFHPADEDNGYDMTVEADGYETATVNVRVKASYATVQDVYVRRSK